MEHNKFNTAHLNVLKCGLYLGNDHLEIDDVTWCQIGFDSCLVTKQSATAQDTRNALLGEMPSTDNMRQQISNQDFWMIADGNWRGPS